MSEDTGYRLWSFLTAASKCKSLDELNARFQNLIAPHGVVSSGVAVINRPAQIIQDGWGLPHPEWTQVYLQNNYLRDDPIFRSAVLRRTRGYWKTHLKGLSLEGKADQVMADARAFGLNDGFTQFMTSSEMGGVFLLCLHGGELDDSPEAKMLIETASQRYVDEALRLLTRPLETSGEPEIMLTERQKRVIELLTRGFSQNVVADSLGISHRTVEKHVRDLKDRLGAANGWEAMRIVYERGLMN